MTRQENGKPRSLELETGMRVCFANLHSLALRDANEIKGLLGPYPLNGTARSDFDQDDLDMVSDSLSGQSRKTPNSRHRASNSGAG